MQEKGLSCNKQSCEEDKYQTIKVLSNICESESWSKQAIKWSSKAIKHVKIAKQSSKQIESPCLEKIGYPLIDQLNATFSLNSVQAWSSKFPNGVAKLWTRIFHVRPHSIGKTRFYLWKINFWKSQSHYLFYFYFKGKIKQERKTLKCDSIIFGKAYLWKTRV